MNSRYKEILFLLVNGVEEQWTPTHAFFGVYLVLDQGAGVG